jgi:hypothetical protein
VKSRQGKNPPQRSCRQPEFKAEADMPPGKRVKWLHSYPSSAPHLLVSTLDGIVVLQDLHKGVGLKDLALGLSREKHVPQQLQQPAHPEVVSNLCFPCQNFPMRVSAILVKANLLSSDQTPSIAHVQTSHRNWHIKKRTRFRSPVFATPDQTERKTFHARQLSKDEHVSI